MLLPVSLPPLFDTFIGYHLCCREYTTFQRTEMSVKWFLSLMEFIRSQKYLYTNNYNSG